MGWCAVERNSLQIVSRRPETRAWQPLPSIFMPEERKKQFSKRYSVRNASRLVKFGKTQARQNDGYACLVRAFLVIMTRSVTEGGRNL